MAKVVDKKAKKLEILYAAMTVFARKGINDTKVHHIAEEAGISKGAIYLYYKSKDEIFQEIINLHIQFIEMRLPDLTTSIGDPGDKLKSLIIEMVHGTEHGHGGIILEIWSTLIREAKKYKPETILKSTRNLIKCIIDEGIEAGVFRGLDSDHLAATIISMLQGLAIMQLADKKGFPAQEVIDSFIDVILRGISANKE